MLGTQQLIDHRKSQALANVDNNTLFNRRFMFAAPISGGSSAPPSSFSGPMGPPIPSQDQVGFEFPGMQTRIQPPSQLERHIPNSDYNLFLRSFDSNQRLTFQGNQTVQSEMERYKVLHQQPTNRFNLVQAPAIPIMDRTGVQTRWNTRKNEDLQQNMAQRQLIASFTPQGPPGGIPPAQISTRKLRQLKQ